MAKKPTSQQAGLAVAEPPKPEKVTVRYHPNDIVKTQATLKGLVQSPSFARALQELAPRHLKAERLGRMVIAASSRNPRLLQCTQASLLKSAIEATLLGLDCTDRHDQYHS